MKKISINAIPNQELTVNINDTRYDITLKLIQPRVMVCNVSIDEQMTVLGQRIVPGQFLLPYRHMEKDGNFALSVPESEDIDYQQFGESQFLYWVSAEELEQLRNGD